MNASSDGELVSVRELLPGHWLQTYRAPPLASRAQPGHYVHVRAPRGWGPPLRRPITIHGIDRARGELTLHVAGDAPGMAWLSTLGEGDRVPLLGPLGRQVRLDARTHHLLLIAEGLDVARLRPIADAALEASRRVTLLLGASGAAQVYPSSLLPDEVEYVVATRDGSVGHRGTVRDLVPDYEAWADQAVAAGPLEMMAELVRFAAGRDARLGVARLGRRGGRTTIRARTRAARRSWLTVVLGHSVGCALGVCLGCVVPGSSGPVRVCREGPTFAAHELDWSEAG